VLDLVGYPGGPEGDAEAFLKPDTVHHSFAPGPVGPGPLVDRRESAADHLSANTTPAGEPAWKSVPSWAVVGTEDRVIPPDTQRRMAERAGATITDVSRVSNPQVTIDAILAAAAAVGD